ncbi:MAG: hypothetical protein GY807_16685 [Gammaproteobacteria bacterium]|nr:hypothetical protein [Gammaproteobacteria bacterium]
MAGQSNGGGEDPLGWLSNAYAGWVAQAIIDGIVIIFAFLFASGTIDDPVFGAAWWVEYRNWSFGFIFPLICGIYFALKDLWWLSLIFALIAFLVFLFFQQESCVPFELCNHIAFIAWGTTFAFLAPAIAVVLLLLVRKLLT